jgi:hypothetical protein
MMKMSGAALMNRRGGNDEERKLVTEAGEKQKRGERQQVLDG